MKNATKTPKYEKIIVKDFSNFNWHDETIKDEVSSNFMFNVSLKNKTIKSGLGISTPQFPASLNDNAQNIFLNVEITGQTYLNNVLYFKQYFPDTNTTAYRLLFHGSNKKLYINQLFISSSALTWLYSMEFDTAPICLTYKLGGNDTIILSSPEKMMVWTTNQAPYEVSNIPVITSMCISNNVLFCTIAGEANKIWYCTTLNPELIGTTTNNTKYLSLDDDYGYAKKIFTFKENLYVFRDYGITKLSYYSPNEIASKLVYVSDSKIFANTVTVCGNVVMFLTRDGIYSFDGINVTKKIIGIEKFLSDANDYAVGGSLQDKYYLGLRLDFNDSKTILCESLTYKNNALIVIDLKDWTFELMRGVDIKYMLPLKVEKIEKMLVTFNSGEVTKLGEISNSAKYFDVDISKFYSTNELLKDNLKDIIIRKVKCIATAGVNIRIVSSDKTFDFVTIKNGINIFQTMINCNNFKLEISSNENDINIKYIEIEYYKN